ncbi:hypothetical protein [Streptomyces sp. UNOC14_S4]|uniref:hypothetical protein n=1 Tax=Streptomyces sp. UNOC14_S4 TaxID=2872340 RepID=UPI001E5DD2B1|nr:hypothetical protein [Streptomyces sp. UNOC14_S4]MCC3766463.1 hypothetical protein [Streptomyces sp. UNOC14_S4]
MALSKAQELAIAQVRGEQRHAGRKALRAISEKNVAEKRARLAREGKARRAAELRRHAPAVLGERVTSVEAPVTFKTGPRNPRRVVREVPSVVLADVKVSAPVPTTVTAAEIPAELRKHVGRLKERGELKNWAEIGQFSCSGGQCMAYVRLRGASPRYGVVHTH